MDKSQILALYDQDQRKDVEYPDGRREVMPNVVRHIDTTGSGEGTVTYSQLNEAEAILVLDLDEVPEMLWQPASAACIYFPRHSQFASLWGGSTVGGFRKQGLYAALLSVRAQEAKTHQVRYLTVDTSPMSRPILEKFHFEMIAYSYPCKWKRHGQQSTGS